MTSLPPPPPPPPDDDTTFVPASGLTAWSAPDPSQPPAGSLAGGTPIRVVEHRGAWTRVLDPQGASWWVDGRMLAGGAAVQTAPARSGAQGGKWLMVLGVIAVAAVAIFFLTRDGGDGQVSVDRLDAEEQAVAQSLSQALRESEGLTPDGGGLGGLGAGAGGMGLSLEQTDCIAAGVVTDLGVERLEELGVTSGGVPDDRTGLENLTRAEREQVADRALACVDLEELLADTFEQQGIDPSVGACLLDGIGEDTIKEILVLALGGEELDLEADPEIAQRIFGALFTCMPEDLELDLGG